MLTEVWGSYEQGDAPTFLRSGFQLVRQFQAVAEIVKVSKTK
jgi:hypothetical protein